MKIKNVQYNDARVSPTIAVEFDGRQPTLLLVEDLIEVLSEAYSCRGLTHEFHPQQGGHVPQVCGGTPACYLIKQEGRPVGLDTLARVVAETETDRAYVSMFDIQRQHEFLPKYAQRLSALIEQGK